MKVKKIASVLFVLTLFGGSAFGGEKVAVIVNAKNTETLTATDIKNIYKDNVINWKSGARVAVYDLPVKSEFREIFSQKILGMSARDAVAEWANKKITNTAKNPPITKPETVVVSNVASDTDAIGYVSPDAAKRREGVRVIMLLE